MSKSSSLHHLAALALVGLGRRGSQDAGDLDLRPFHPLFLGIGSYFALPAFREKLTFFLSTHADALMAWM